MEWIKSYLENRRQIVDWEGSLSMAKSITYGVPQGSNMGPLLFLSYINDFVNVISKGEMTVYVDEHCTVGKIFKEFVVRRKGDG